MRPSIKSLHPYKSHRAYQVSESRLWICFIVKLIKSSLSQETHIVKDM